MIKVKKNAIKYKDTDGHMQNIDMLCQIGALSGGDITRYVKVFNSLFKDAVFDDMHSVTFNFASISPSSVDSNHVNIGRMFYNTAGLERIKLISNSERRLAFMGEICRLSVDLRIFDISECDFIINNLGSGFQNCYSLEEIRGVIEFAPNTALNFSFGRCDNLRDIRFTKENISQSVSFNNSNLLSDESIQSIIDGLATVETQQTLTLHADVKSKLTENQLTTITSKNWVLA